MRLLPFLVVLFMANPCAFALDSAESQVDASSLSPQVTDLAVDSGADLSKDGVAEAANEANANNPRSNSLIKADETSLPSTYKSKVTISEAANWPFVALTLLGMVACILLIAWFVKRFSGMSGMGGKDLNIVSALAVGTRERIAVVDVRGEQFLVGVTSQQISLLHHFDEAPITTGAGKTSEFAEKLQGILNLGESSRKAKAMSGAPSSDSPESDAAVKNRAPSDSTIPKAN